MSHPETPVFSLTLVTLTLLAAAPTAAAAGKPSAAALISAAKAAKLTEIDSGRTECGDTRNVAEWLKQTIVPTARRIAWTAGRCLLVIPENPIDGGGNWCAQAEIQPKKGHKRATIEIYFEEPVNGKPGVPYAFRAETDLRDGDSDYSRDTVSFEYNWRQAHEPRFDDETKICAPAEDAAH